MSYRHAASHSPTLVQLAERARQSRLAGNVPEPPQLFGTSVERRHELAADVYGDRSSLGIASGLLWALTFVVLIGSINQSAPMNTTNIYLLIGCAVGAVVTLLVSWSSSAAANQRRATAVSREFQWETRQPFEVTGYRAWLASRVPMMTLQLRHPIDTAMFADAISVIDPAIEVEAFDACTLSIKIPPRHATIDQVEIPFGNAPLLKTLVARLLIPLHHDIGIERLAMGGTAPDQR